MLSVASRKWRRLRLVDYVIDRNIHVGFYVNWFLFDLNNFVIHTGCSLCQRSGHFCNRNQGYCTDPEC